MRCNRIAFLAILVCICTAEIWIPLDATNLKRQIPSSAPQNSVFFNLNVQELREALGLPQRVGVRSIEIPISIPLPDGTIAFVHAEENDLLSDFSKTRTTTRTYDFATEDKTVSGSFDISDQGVHGTIFIGEDIAFIRPTPLPDLATAHLVFADKDNPLEIEFNCGNDDHSHELSVRETIEELRTTKRVLGSAFSKTYRIAIATTGEFTSFYQGQGNAFSGVVTILNRVNLIYRRELGVTFQLVSSETLCFTSNTSDPFTNGDNSAMLDQSHSTLNAALSSSGYDIGHTFGYLYVASAFSYRASGLATLSSLCSSSWKGRAVSSASDPSEERFATVIVVHEIGHQLAAGHTMNSNNANCISARSSGSAVEPGAGSTIMGYTTCGSDNIVSSTDSYFHATSLNQMSTFINSIPSCGSNVASTNNAPSWTSFPNAFTIPINTFWRIEAEAVDPNPNTVIYYTFEQVDVAPFAAALNSADDGNIPLFRSYPPSEDNYREFFGGSNTEKLPLLGRTITVGITARDLHATFGQAIYGTVSVTVNGQMGPFDITSPNPLSTVNSPGVISLSWSVANTFSIAATVQLVLFSATETFLLGTTENDGSAQFNIPAGITPGNQYHLRLEASNFFDQIQVTVATNALTTGASMTTTRMATTAVPTTAVATTAVLTTAVATTAVATTRAATTGTSVCGDFIVSGNEQCDNDSPCCVQCAFASASTICRPANPELPCDRLERCTGNSVVCPVDTPQAQGVVCRAKNGVCDVADTCDGVLFTCTDRVESPRVVCRAAPLTSLCDLPELCDGESKTCPEDVVKAPGVLCRTASGICDIDEVCDGESPLCPIDRVASSSVICRESQGICDRRENCTGQTKLCPTNTFLPSTVQCDDGVNLGLCDNPRTCTGASAFCNHTRTRKPTGTICRTKNGDCDLQDTCSATGECEDRVATPNVVCRPVAGVCDVAESCNGVSKACPVDLYKLPSVTCRNSAGVCDVAETCTGQSPTCPPNRFRGPTPGVTEDLNPLICRNSTGICDPAEYCTGRSAACPINNFYPNSHKCRIKQSSCDITEYCNGRTSTCPIDRTGCV